MSRHVQAIEIYRLQEHVLPRLDEHLVSIFRGVDGGLNLSEVSAATRVHNNRFREQRNVKHEKKNRPEIDGTSWLHDSTSSFRASDTTRYAPW